MTATATLEPLTAELALWRQAGARAPLWWRDDDLVAPTPRLERLRREAERRGVPVLMSVIPAAMQDALPAAVLRCPAIQVCQHGFSHANHEPVGQSPAEFGPHRATDAALLDIEQGQARLAGQFGDRLLAVFVAPWHVLRSDIALHLPRLGLTGLSGYGRLDPEQAAPGLVRLNAHVDILNWAEPRADDVPPASLHLIAERLAGALSGLRQGAPQLGRAIGLLTHHRAMGDKAWESYCLLLDCLLASGAVQFRSPQELFQPVPDAATPPDRAMGGEPMSQHTPAVPEQAGPSRRTEPFDALAALPEFGAVAGEERLTACPACGGSRSGRLWQVPLLELPPGTQLSAPGTGLNRLALRHLPGTGQPQRLYCFDLCGDCHAVFRNPRDAAPEATPLAERHAAALPARAIIARALLRLLPDETRVVLDANCGTGATLAALAPLLPGRRLIGLAASPAEAEFAAALDASIEAHVVEADRLPTSAVLPSASVDFILLLDGFGRHSAALDRLRRLMALLRPGGRLHLAVPCHDPKRRQLLRPQEPLLFCRGTRDFLVQSLTCRLAEATEDGATMRLTLERT